MGLFLGIKRVMGVHTLDSEVNIVEDLTAHRDVDIWIAQAQTGGYQGNQPQVEYEPHRPPAASQESERRQLAKKINDIIKANAVNMEASGADKSTGLNRPARWGMEKLAAGSILPVGGAVTATAPTGNTANSQAVARKAAQGVRFFFLQSGPHYNYNFLPPRL